MKVNALFIAERRDRIYTIDLWENSPDLWKIPGWTFSCTIGKVLSVEEDENKKRNRTMTSHYDNRKDGEIRFRFARRALIFSIGRTDSIRIASKRTFVWIKLPSLLNRPKWKSTTRPSASTRIVKNKSNVDIISKTTARKQCLNFIF